MSRPGDAGGGAAAPCDEKTLVRLKAAFARARGGNVVRVRELLADEGLEVASQHFDLPGPRRRFARPAATRRANTTSRPARRCSMTPSPHRVRLGQSGKPVTLQCAGPGAGLLAPAVHPILSAQLHAFRGASAFLLEAARFMAGVCQRSASSTTPPCCSPLGKRKPTPSSHRRWPPSARTLGFGFRAHRVGNPDLQRQDRTALRLRRAQR